MSTKSRQVGTEWETRLLRWFRDQGLETERLRLAGKDDEGDLAVKDDGLIYVVEAKAEQKINLSGYMNEVTVERVNYAKARRLDVARTMPIAIVKRRNYPVERAYVVTELREFFSE